MPANTPSQVMIYVQHLLGIGHLKRCWLLARALADSGISVALISGGMPVSGLDMTGLQFYQLPPVRCPDASFDQLVDVNGKTVDGSWKIRRRDQLLQLFHSISPEVLVTETFPFGRRMMRFELLPLLEAAQQAENPPVIVSSIRDILQPKSSLDRNREVVEYIQAYYDQVIIHGDPGIADLEVSFPLASSIIDKLNYSGYISNEATDNNIDRTGINEVIVSGGGGAASQTLLKTAIAAKPYSQFSQLTWRILAGNNPSEDTLADLQRIASDGFIVEANRNDFPQLLKNCTVSVSQAGYNTVMDILQQKTPAVLVPFSEAGEMEQSLRARGLAKLGRVQLLNETDLCAKKLAKAIDRAATTPITHLSVNLQGLSNSVQLITSWLHE